MSPVMQVGPEIAAPVCRWAVVLCCYVEMSLVGVLLRFFGIGIGIGIGLGWGRRSGLVDNGY